MILNSSECTQNGAPILSYEKTQLDTVHYNETYVISEPMLYKKRPGITCITGTFIRVSALHIQQTPEVDVPHVYVTRIVPWA